MVRFVSNAIIEPIFRYCHAHIKFSKWAFNSNCNTVLTQKSIIEYESARKTAYESLNMNQPERQTKFNILQEEEKLKANAAKASLVKYFIALDRRTQYFLYQKNAITTSVFRIP